MVNHMAIRTLENGQSLMEILFAVTIFTIGIVTIGYLSIDAQRSLGKSLQFTQAQLLASEGIEVTKILRDNNFEYLTEGTHGLILEDGIWSLFGTEDSIPPGFTRSIMINDVTSGIKEIVSTVTWTDSSQVPRDVSYNAYITDWRTAHADAESFSVDVTNATLSGSLDAVTNISFQNTGPSPVSIASVVVEWDNSSTLNQIIFQGTEMFFSPDGVVSGSIVDIDDYVVGVGTGLHTIDQILFSDPMAGTNMTLTFVMSDGSQSSVVMNF